MATATTRESSLGRSALRGIFLLTGLHNLRVTSARNAATHFLQSVYETRIMKTSYAGCADLARIMDNARDLFALYARPTCPRAKPSLQSEGDGMRWGGVWRHTGAGRFLAKACSRGRNMHQRSRCLLVDRLTPRRVTTVLISQF